jgi:predicted Zn-dependent protease
MKGYVLLVALVTLLVSCSRAGPAAETKEQKVLTISSTCDVDPNLVSTIEAHVSFNLGTKLRRGKCLSLEDPSLDDIAKASFKSLQPQDLYGVVLYDLPTNEVNVTIYSIKDRLAVINLDRLRRGTPRLSDDDERFVRRVKKESMRALGTLIKVRKCPTYTCAMYPVGDDTNSLDRKGYNFCPPHRIASDKLLVDAGLDVKNVVDQAIELHEQERQKNTSSD